MRNFIIPIVLGASCITLSACDSAPTDHIAEARSAVKDNEFQNARVHLLNTLRENPRDIEANILYAQVMLRLGDGDSALTALEKLPTDYENLRTMKAHALILRGRSIDVLNQYQNIDKSQYNDQDWRMLIWAKFETNRVNETLDDINEALAKHPDNPDLLSISGNYHLTKLNNSQALTNANEALQFDQTHYDALNLAGRATLRLNQIDEAQKYYERAASFHPDNPIPIINLAGIAMDKSDLKKASDYVEQAERLNSALPLTKFVKARYANLTGDNATAKEILQDSKSGLDNFGPAIFLSGKVAYDLGEFTFAQARLERSLAIDPVNEQARQMLAKIAQR